MKNSIVYAVVNTTIYASEYSIDLFVSYDDARETFKELRAEMLDFNPDGEIMDDTYSSSRLPVFCLDTEESFDRLELKEITIK